MIGHSQYMMLTLPTEGSAMYKFGAKSLAELETCHGHLIGIAHKVLKIKDHSILKGHRNQADQTAAFYGNPQRSKVQWPHGKHNGKPSNALDAKTWPVPETEPELREEQLYLLGLYRGIAAEMGIELRTGADWDRDGEIADNGFDDFFHVELVI